MWIYKEKKVCSVTNEWSHSSFVFYGLSVLVTCLLGWKYIEVKELHVAVLNYIKSMLNPSAINALSYLCLVWLIGL